MRLRWAIRARWDIASIIYYISDDSPAAAHRQVQRIEERSLDLIDYPLIGRPGRLRRTRELVVVGTPYILIYRMAGDVVEIVRVIHGAQRWPPARRTRR